MSFSGVIGFVDIGRFGVPLKLIGPLAALPPFAGAVGMFLRSPHVDRHRERVWHQLGRAGLSAVDRGLK